jgi:5-methylcytosine-specific restriction protein B
LFGANVNVSAHNLPWTINDAAFERDSAYAGIIKVQATVEDIMETLIGEEA